MSANPHTRRVFIGIQVTDELADLCVQLQQEFADLPGRFTPREDLHLTLVPPFEMEDQRQVDTLIKTILQSSSPFELRLENVDYAPTPHQPRLAWVECKPLNELVELRRALVEGFEYQDRYDFRPHITLARFKDQDRDLLKTRPIERVVDRSMDVTSVALFESVHREGVRYRVLQTYALVG